MVDASQGLGLFSLEGKVIVVTGASSGIGLEIARGLAAAGAAVGLNGRGRRRLEARTREIPGSFALPFDVSDLTAAEAGLAAALARHGRLDGLFCNAAMRDRRPLADIEPEHFRRLLDTNLVSPFQLARLAARHMAEHGSGRIVFLASLAGPFARPDDPAYTASKGGVAALVRALAVDLGGRGINVNGIAPGAVASETNRPLTADPGWQRSIERSVPLKRWGRPAELAGAAIFLASEASSYVNGHILTVDGGASVPLFP